MPDLLNAQKPDDAVQKKNEPAADKKVPSVSKRPSKLFTEYYGSMILLLIALLVGAGYLVIKPQIDDYKSMTAQTQARQTDIKNEQSYLDELSRSVAAAQSISPDVLEKVDQALPRAFDIPGMLVQLDEIAKAQGAKITSVTFDEADKKTAATGGLQAININLSVEARGYAGVKTFLKGIELSLRLFDVQNIALTGLDKDKIDFSLQMRTYYYPSGKTALTAATPR